MTVVIVLSFISLECFQNLADTIHAPLRETLTIELTQGIHDSLTFLLFDFGSQLLSQ